MSQDDKQKLVSTSQTAQEAKDVQDAIMRGDHGPEAQAACERHIALLKRAENKQVKAPESKHVNIEQKESKSALGDERKQAFMEQMMLGTGCSAYSLVGAPVGPRIHRFKPKPRRGEAHAQIKGMISSDSTIAAEHNVNPPPQLYCVCGPNEAIIVVCSCDRQCVVALHALTDSRPYFREGGFPERPTCRYFARTMTLTGEVRACDGVIHCWCGNCKVVHWGGQWVDPQVHECRPNVIKR